MNFLNRGGAAYCKFPRNSANIVITMAAAGVRLSPSWVRPFLDRAFPLLPHPVNLAVPFRHGPLRLLPVFTYRVRSLRPRMHRTAKTWCL